MNDELIEYLKKSGHAKLLEEFEKVRASGEVSSSSSSSSSGGGDSAKIAAKDSIDIDVYDGGRQSAGSGFAEDIKMQATIAEKNRHLHSTEYSALCSWSMSSLEMIRSEYLSVLFPIFVHSYISLIRQNFIAEAKEFWDTFESDHHLYNPSELNELAFLQRPEQIDDPEFLKHNVFLKKSLSLRFVVTISEFAYSLLLRFLVQKELKTIVLIIQEQINFQRIQSTPSGLYRPYKFENDTDETLRSSHTASVVSWGVPGTATAVANSRIFDIVKSKFFYPDVRNDEHYLAWIDCIVQAEVLLAPKEGTGSTGGGRAGASSGMDSSIENAAASLKSHRASKSNPINPSILFASIGNSYEGMICMDINDSITQIVGGFKDNCVRVWRLDEDKSQSTRKKSRSRGGAGSEQDSGRDAAWFGQLLPAGKRSMSNPIPQINIKSSDKVHDRSNDSNSGLDNLGANFGQLEDDDKYPLLQLRGHSRPVHAVHQDASSRLVVSVSSDETARLWDLHLSQCVCKYRIGSPSWDVKFSPLGYYFATANMDGSALLYSVDRDVPIRVMTGHMSDVTSIAWNNNANYFLTGSDDKTCRLWDIRTGNCERLFRGCSSAVSATAFSPLGNMVAAGSDSGTIYSWDVGSGALISIMQDHEGAVNSLSFSSDCDAIASGGSDCTVRIWDISLMKSNIHTALNYSSEILKGAKSIDPICIQATHSFHTKFTSVYNIKYSPLDLICAGGPFCKILTEGFPSLDLNLANASETEAAISLGISKPIPII